MSYRSYFGTIYGLFVYQHGPIIINRDMSVNILETGEKLFDIGELADRIDTHIIDRPVRLLYMSVSGPSTLICDGDYCVGQTTDVANMSVHYNTIIAEGRHIRWKIFYDY